MKVDWETREFSPGSSMHQLSSSLRAVFNHLGIGNAVPNAIQFQVPQKQGMQLISHKIRCIKCRHQY